MEHLRLKTVFKLSLILLVVNASATTNYPRPGSLPELSESQKANFLNLTNTQRQEVINFAFTERFGCPSSVAENATACVFRAVTVAGKEGAGFGECVTGFDSMVGCIETAMEASGLNTSSRVAFKNYAHELISINETCSTAQSTLAGHELRFTQSFLVHVYAVQAVFNFLLGNYIYPLPFLSC